MPLQSLVMDLVTLAVICLCAAYYARRGFIAGVFSLFGTLIAVLLAGLAARHLSPAIFDRFFRAGIEEQVAGAINQQGIYDAGALLGAVIPFLPESLVASIAANMDLALDFAAPDIAALVVDQVVAPLVVPFIMVIVFFILFSLVRVLVGVVRSVAVGLNRMPAMGTVNSALGAVAGLFIGALYVYIALCVIFAYDALNPTSAMGEAYFGRSITFRLLSNLNFFAMWLE